MNIRVARHTILPMILERWSPRAFDPSQPILRSELATLFEAARWAPSAFNVQPWRFIFALRDDPGWDAMVELLIPFNKSWAASASALVCVASQTDAPGKTPTERFPSYSHSFDAGAAWAFLALQAHSMGLCTHAMTGFDVERAKTVLRLPANVRLDAIVAVGHQGPGDHLPEELRSRDIPSDRQSIEEFVFEGTFDTPIERLRHGF
ncbi:nitroreductase [Variovorax boronicumulans]|uniref:Nitroreductase n=1 Tax=Variovorax boronicumulans TaxID=436515 RepID=A0AAW8D388_9BURK|nr:nitroreductase family protein [Variovorax boronicumulans]MDP9896857.1 nitroreductase [Variovorax boronicumulans]MDP9993945.1 nitroreductase [Variovorax boronicumulans]MDQ0005192.1 nitroreductase [Variovorax boronicumulans]MDQ0038989.1 nitroreductase [Variovorax boronicumulans]MDQ0044726.1 nitroreductase [Variovorax boronicumulans]